MSDIDLDAIRDDIEMAARSPEMARHVALDHGPELVAEVERLHAWDGLMSLVDEHYPTDIFPHFAGVPDNPDRDPGPRILSLLREIERLRKITDIIDPDSVYREQRDQAWAERDALRAAIERVRKVADAYDQTATRLPTPHGPTTEAFTIAARDILAALEADR
jgi:hypothetical protein